jgi:hypothetical protein
VKKISEDLEGKVNMRSRGKVVKETRKYTVDGIGEWRDL